MFHCYRKEKYGFLLMARCDHETKFRWADIRHPAACSDYLAWVSSDVGQQLENDDSNLVLKDHTIVKDNAFVENQTTATPIPALSITITEEEDNYNFYLSQVRITIERAFGILVHRWGVLRGHSNPDLEYLRTKFDTRRTKNQKPKTTNKLP